MMKRVRQAAKHAVLSAHPEYSRWFRHGMLPNHLIGERTDGTYRAVSLTDDYQEVDIYPMQDDLIHVAGSVSLRDDTRRESDEQVRQQIAS